MTEIDNGIEAYAAKLRGARRMTPVVQDAIEQALFVQQNNDIIYYIAGALTDVDDAIKERYRMTSKLINRLATPAMRAFGYAPHVNSTDPLEHPDVTPQEVRDIHYLWAAKVATFHINFLDPVAHDNAVEAGWAEEHDIPSIYLIQKGVTPSRLVCGMSTIAAVIEYDDFATDGIEQLEAYLVRMLS